MFMSVRIIKKIILNVFFIHCVVFIVIVFSDNSLARASDIDDDISSFIDDSFADGGDPIRYRITVIDSSFYVRLKPKEVSPGEHTVRYLTCGGGRAECLDQTVSCIVVSRYIYRVDSHGCFQYKRRTDFKGADDYWAKIDADLNKSRAEMARSNLIAAEQAEANRYKLLHDLLDEANSTSDIDNIIRDIKSRLNAGIHKDDPDNLMSKAMQKRDLFEKSEFKENASILS
jgi:hypothetical protein